MHPGDVRIMVILHVHALFQSFLALTAHFASYLDVQNFFVHYCLLYIAKGFFNAFNMDNKKVYDLDP